MSDLQWPDAAGTTPTVFLSYRRTDRAPVVELAERLRADLGPRNVFRDEDDLIGGEDWRAALDERIDRSTCMLVIIGQHWEGVAADGSRRIDDPGDVVGFEVRRSLEPGGSTPTPVLVDRDVPTGLPADLAALFDVHAVSVSSTTLDSDTESDYPRVLAAAWNSLRSAVPRGVVVVAGRNAELRLAEFVRTLNSADLIDARFLSRFGTGMCLISPRRARKRAEEWPDAIVLLDDDEDHRAALAFLRALAQHPGFATIAAVGSAGAVAAVAASGLAGVVGVETTRFVAGLSGSPTPAPGPRPKRWSTGAKVGIAAAVAGLAVAGIVVGTSLGDTATSPPDTRTAPTEPAPVETASPPETDAPPETEAPPETDTPPETQAPVQTEAPPETDAPPETEAPVPGPTAAGPLVAITADGDALYFPPTDGPEGLAYDARSAPPGRTGPVVLYEPSGESTTATLRAAVTPDGSSAWVSICCEGQLYRTSPPDRIDLGDEPSSTGLWPAVDPSGTYLATGRFAGVIVGIERIDDGTSFEAVATGEGLVVFAFDVMWLDEARVAVLASVGPLESEESPDLILYIARVGDGQVDIEEEFVLPFDADSIQFGGLVRDEIVVHVVGAEEAGVVSAVTGEVTGSLAVPATANAFWLDGDRVVRVDRDGTLRVDDDVVDGEYVWARG